MATHWAYRLCLIIVAINFIRSLQFYISLLGCNSPLYWTFKAVDLWPKSKDPLGIYHWSGQAYAHIICYLNVITSLCSRNCCKRKEIMAQKRQTISAHSSANVSRERIACALNCIYTIHIYRHCSTALCIQMRNDIRRVTHRCILIALTVTDHCHVCIVYHAHQPVRIQRIHAKVK